MLQDIGALGKKHVLIGEDDPLVGSTIADMLEEEGHRATHARTAAEVRALLENGASGIDVILLDLGLARGDAGALLALAQERRVCVVLMSGAPQHVLTGGGGGLIFIAKPFRVHELLDAIERGEDLARQAR